MENNELLQAIRKIVKEEVNPVKQDISGLKAGQKSLKQAQAKTEIMMEKGQTSLQQQVTKTNFILENDVSKKLDALFDGNKLNTELIQSIKDKVGNIEKSVDSNDTLSRVNAREIQKLKKIG